MCGPTPNCGCPCHKMPYFAHAVACCTAPSYNEKPYGEIQPEKPVAASSVLPAPILQGVVGSTAYGLDRPGSDIDRLGMYVAPTQAFLGLSRPKETRTSSKPDITMHEIGKFCGLALKGNPTILELLWLDEYEVVTRWGQRLLNIRQCFLSEKAVRSAYHGYALQQVNRLQRREEEGKQGFGDVPVNRTAKHARHCMRLLRQGRELLETGRLTIRVPDPEFYWQFDDASVEEIASVFARESRRFTFAKSVLPAEPSRDTVEKVLLGIRRDFY